jgi:4-oxalocrotonate tautomerase
MQRSVQLLLGSQNGFAGRLKTPRPQPSSLRAKPMPIVRIDAPITLAPDRLRGVADAVHTALVAHMDVPPADRFQIIRRHEEAHLLIDETYPSVARSPDAVIISIALRAGRSDEQKRAFYKAVVANAAANAAFRPDDLLITVSENALIDWSFGRGEVFPAPPKA